MKLDERFKIPVSEILRKLRMTRLEWSEHLHNFNNRLLKNKKTAKNRGFPFFKRFYKRAKRPASTAKVVPLMKLALSDAR